MKTKKFNKKLTVNKETIADLNTEAMSGIKRRARFILALLSSLAIN